MLSKNWTLPKENGEWRGVGGGEGGKKDVKNNITHGN